MMVKIFFLIIGTLVFLATLYAAEEDYRDPFESLIPMEVEGEQEGLTPEKKEASLPSLNVQGVLWGTDSPQTIIEGEVYKVGDEIEGVKNAQVFRIEKNTVFISYKNKIYELKTKIGEEK